MIPKVDKIDQLILTELLAGSNQPLESISTKVGISKTPVWSRIRKLEKMGVIKGYTINVDFDMLGFEAGFFVLVKTSEHEAGWQKRFLEAVRNRPEVLKLIVLLVILITSSKFE